MCNLSKGVEEQGRMKGRAEARLEGIHAMTHTLKKLQIPPEIILREICGQFGLTKEEAEKYVS